VSGDPVTVSLTLTTLVSFRYFVAVLFRIGVDRGKEREKGEERERERETACICTRLDLSFHRPAIVVSLL